MGDILNNKNFNLVFSEWDGNKPLPNGYVDGFGVKIPYYILNDVRLRPKIFRLEEVTEDKDFYYIITYRTDLSFTMTPERFIIPEKVMEVSKEKNLKIVLFNEHEVNVHEYDVMKLLVNEIRKRGIREENIYYINNNSKLRYYKEKLNSRINVITSKFLCDFICSILVKQPAVFKKKRDFLFLCHNRTAKSHRLLTLAFLKKHGILENTDYSFVGSTDYAKNVHLQFKRETYKSFENQVEFFKNGPNIMSKCERDKANWFSDPNVYHPGDMIESECFSNSYINIVTESIFNFNQVHISEKSFRPFYFLQLPIFVASYQHVQYMKETYGFDFFDDIIDHSYDDERDDDRRILKVLNEIKRLNENKNDVVEFFSNNLDRLIANNQKIHALDAEKKALKELKYIAKMDNITIPQDPVVRGKKILITGCNGLVGTYLVRKCLEKNYEVVGVDVTENKNNSGADFRFLKMDLTREENINYLFDHEKPDVVLNAFGIKGSPIKAKESPVDFLYPSFKINTEIINKCAKKNIWLVFVSSIGVYCPAEVLTESDVWKKMPGEADWFPSWSKRMGELLLEAYKVQYNYENWAIIRPANIFGEYDDFSGNGTVIASTIKKISESSEFIEAWGDGSPIRDFVYAPDVADAIIELYERGLKTTVVNFGSGEERTIAEIIHSLIGVSGKKLSVNWDRSKPNGDLKRKMDTAKQRELDLLPKTNFIDALNRTYNHYIKSKRLI